MGASRLPTEVEELLSGIGGLSARIGRPVLSSHSIRVGSVSCTVSSHCNTMRRRWALGRWAVVGYIVTIAGSCRFSPSSRFSSASTRGVGGGGVNRKAFSLTGTVIAGVSR